MAGDADIRSLVVSTAKALDSLRVAARREGTRAFECDDSERAAALAEFLSGVVKARDLLQETWERSPFAPLRTETEPPEAVRRPRARPASRSGGTEPFEVWLREEFPGLPYARHPRGWFHIGRAPEKPIVVRQRKCQNRIHDDKWWWEVTTADMEDADFLAFYGSSPYRTGEEQHKFWMILHPETIEEWLPQLGVRRQGSWDVNVRLRDGDYELFYERMGLSKPITGLVERVSPLHDELYRLSTA